MTAARDSGCRRKCLVTLLVLLASCRLDGLGAEDFGGTFKTAPSRQLLGKSCPEDCSGVGEYQGSCTMNEGMQARWPRAQWRWCMTLPDAA